VTGPNGLPWLGATRESSLGEGGGVDTEAAGQPEADEETWSATGSEVPNKKTHEGVGPLRTGNRKQTDTVDSPGNTLKIHRGGEVEEFFGARRP
jgi:hypothetical protein